MKNRRLIFMLTTLVMLPSMPGVASAIVNTSQDVKRISAERIDQPLKLDVSNATAQPVTVVKQNAQDDGQTQKAPDRLTFKTFTVNGVTFLMMQVLGGEFTMGATSEQGSEALSNESPTHTVNLNDFWMGEKEVSQELFQAVMGYNPSRFTGDLSRPVENVSWNDCQAFILKLNELTGSRFRLPTEAEWEYAARGGQSSNGYKYSGSNDINKVAWYSGNSDGITHPVGSKSTNELGLYAMSGNVAEWCKDILVSYSSVGDGASNPWQGGSRYRVVRGGSYNYDARYTRVSYRTYYDWDTRSPEIGFRLVLSNQDGQNITFMQASQQATTDAASTTVKVPVKRSRTVNPTNIDVFVETDQLSNIPLQLATASFSVGQSIAYIEVPFVNMEIGQTYSCTLMLSNVEGTANPDLGEQIVQTTVSVTREGWTTVGTATMTDETWEDDPVTGAVTVQHSMGSNRYRLVSPLYVLYNGIEDDPDQSHFEFLMDDNMNMTIENGYYVNYWGYQMYYNSSYTNYCKVERSGNTYTVNFLLYLESTKALYVGGPWTLTFNWSKDAVAAPATSLAPKPAVVTMRKKEFVPIQLINE